MSLRMGVRVMLFAFAAAVLLLVGTASVVWSQNTPVDDSAAAAICNPIFGAETSAMLIAFNAQKLPHLEACEAYKFLLERNGSGKKGVTPGCYRSQKDRVIKLNPGFAVSLYRALSEIEKQYGGKNIIQSGYRCDPTGNHPRGCAADIIWTSCSRQYPNDTEKAWRCSSDHYDARTNTWSQPEQKWIDANGKSERYKIHLRIRGAPEGHHVEPVNTQGCVTGATYTPGPTSPAPTSGVADYFRQSFGMQPTLAPQPTLPPQPYTQQQPLLNSFSQTAQPQIQPSGVSGQITTTNTNTNQNTNTSSSSATSVADQLLQLAFGTSSAPGSGTNATSVPIVITSANSGSIASTQQTGVTNPQLQNTGSLQPVGQQTFVSNDLRTQQPIAAQTYNSRLQETLGTLKTALTMLLKYLTPFGARVSEYDY